MVNENQIEQLIRLELESAHDGNQYICDGCDGIRFLSHLMYLMTNGKEGEKNECLERKLHRKHPDA